MERGSIPCLRSLSHLTVILVIQSDCYDGQERYTANAGFKGC